MSAADVRDIIARSYTDNHFAELFRANPVAALAPYDLSAEERTALLSGDEDAIFNAIGLRADTFVINDEAHHITNLWPTARQAVAASSPAPAA